MYYLAENNWEEAALIINLHYSSLKDRPEWDGYYTLSEAIEWYSHLIKGDDDNYKSHRLTNIEIDGNESHNIIYDNLGNISFKYDAGSMIYNSTNPYAVRMITDVSDITSFGGSQDVTYTSFDKVKSISQDNKNLHISYGADRQRVRQTLNVGEVSKTKRYFTPRYETISTGGTTKKIHYLTSSTGLFAIFALDSNNSGTMSYVIKDHQGSLNASVTGGAVSHYNFDAWGRRRDPQTLSYDNATASLDRGYTMHEHYDDLGLINMNGRLYDPLIGRMLSPDIVIIVIQDEQNSQAFNRYSYCLNNPLRFTDPSGYIVRGHYNILNWSSTMYYDVDINRNNGNSFNTDLSEGIYSPIYDVNGNFLGTDDEGLQGEAIVMRKEDFKQGMSHQDALSFATDLAENNKEEAEMRMNLHYASLRNRPDWDGYFTLSEANEWFRNGNGQSLYTDLSKIDLSGIVSLGENYVGQTKVINLLFSSNSLNDGLVYGKVTLKRYPNHSVKAYADKYDFDIKPWSNPLNWGRNLETIIGKKKAGEGVPFEINIYGSKQLTPILPWIK